MDYVESICAAFLQWVDSVLHFLGTDSIVQAIGVAGSCVLIGGAVLVCIAGMFGWLDGRPMGGLFDKR